MFRVLDALAQASHAVDGDALAARVATLRGFDDIRAAVFTDYALAWPWLALQSTQQARFVLDALIQAAELSPQGFARHD